MCLFFAILRHRFTALLLIFLRIVRTMLIAANYMLFNVNPSTPSQFDYFDFFLNFFTEILAMCLCMYMCVYLRVLLNTPRHRGIIILLILAARACVRVCVCVCVCVLLAIPCHNGSAIMLISLWRRFCVFVCVIVCMIVRVCVCVSFFPIPRHRSHVNFGGMFLVVCVFMFVCACVCARVFVFHIRGQKSAFSKITKNALWMDGWTDPLNKAVYTASSAVKHIDKRRRYGPTDGRMYGPVD